MSPIPTLVPAVLRPDRPAPPVSDATSPPRPFTRVVPLLAAACLGVVSLPAHALRLGTADEAFAPARAASPEPGRSPNAPPSLAAALPLVPILRFDVDAGPSVAAASLSGGGRNPDERIVFRAFLAGTLSAALPGRRTELAVPFAAIDYRVPESHDNGYRYGHDGDYALRRVDLQLRRFARDGRRGLYAGTLLRASWMDGTAYDPLTGDHGSPQAADVKEDRDDALSRIGAGVVIGVRGGLRIRALPELYWGANLHTGRWLGGSPTTLAAELGSPEKADRYFADVELAKIGIRF